MSFQVSRYANAPFLHACVAPCRPAGNRFGIWRGLGPLFGWEVALVAIFCTCIAMAPGIKSPLNDLYSISYVTTARERATALANQLVFAAPGELSSAAKPKTA